MAALGSARLDACIGTEQREARGAAVRAACPPAVHADPGQRRFPLRKLDGGDFDALVLAAAGMRRLGLGSRITAPIPIDGCVPAPGQGIIAIEMRADDGATRRAVEPIHDVAAGIALAAERALVNALGGGCQLPLAPSCFTMARCWTCTPS